MASLISPNDLQRAACKAMLESRDPITTRDWQLCANYWAANIAKGVEPSALVLLGAIFDCPLSKDELCEIALFQQSKKGEA